MSKEPFVPRKFEALIDEFGLDDVADFTATFEVQSLHKGKIYEERNPEYISKDSSGRRQKGVVIDDNCCWWYEGTEGFKKRFKEIKE